MSTLPLISISPELHVLPNALYSGDVTFENNLRIFHRVAAFYLYIEEVTDRQLPFPYQTGIAFISSSVLPAKLSGFTLSGLDGDFIGFFQRELHNLHLKHPFCDDFNRLLEVHILNHIVGFAHCVVLSEFDIYIFLHCAVYVEGTFAFTQ